MNNQMLLRIIPIYTIAFLFNTIFSLISIMLPLYGLSLGYSATLIGLLLSTPGLLLVLLRMFAGVLSDHFGEKKMLVLTFLLTIIAGLIISLSLSFSTLFCFQIINGTARAIYWPTSQSYASRISSVHSSSILGKFHSFNEGGKISGLLFAGWAITNIGYLGTFRLIVIIGIVGLSLALVMKSIPLTGGERKQVKNLSESFQEMVKLPPLQFAVITSFSAGLLVVLTQSFFPIWLKILENSEGIIAVILTAYSVGSILAGRFFANLIEKTKLIFLMQLSVGGTGLGFLFVWKLSGFIGAFILTLVLGFFAGILTVAYQVMVVENSFETDRGIIMSFAGLGWAIAFLIGPILFGLLVDSLSITIAFACVGFIIIIYAFFIKKIYCNFIVYDHKDYI